MVINNYLKFLLGIGLWASLWACQSGTNEQQTTHQTNQSSNDTSKRLVEKHSPKIYPDSLVKIPAPLIAELRLLKHPQKKQSQAKVNKLVAQIEQLLASDSDKGEFTASSETSDAHLKPLFVNLDESKEEELVLHFGSNWDRFCLIKKIKKHWYVLFDMLVPRFYEFKLYDTSPQTKIFSVTSTRGWGSGYHYRARVFFRIIDEQLVYYVTLGSLGYAQSSGFIPDVEAEVAQVTSESIAIKYNYRYYPDALFAARINGRIPLEDTITKPIGSYDHPFLAGSVVIKHHWNDQKKQYEIKNPTDRKLAEVLSGCGDQKTFYEVFKPQITRFMTHPQPYPFNTLTRKKYIIYDSLKFSNNSIEFFEAPCLQFYPKRKR